MPRINLLPWRAEERKQKQREFAFAAIGAVVAAGAVTLLLSLIMSNRIDQQNEQNQLLKDEIAKLDKQITEILGLENQKQRLIARMDIIQKLQRSRPEVVHLFDQLVKTLPDGVYLTSVKQSDKRLELKGLAQSSTRVSAFMRNIDDSEWLDKPELEVVETKKDAALGSEFTLFANQVGVQLPGEEEQQ
jgi:type IV pilus assembly protein PilN